MCIRDSHCTSQEVDTCALVKVVPMKSWCHIWKYIKSTLHICINGENQTSKSGKIWARKKILVWNIWNYNRLSSKFIFIGQLPVWYLKPCPQRKKKMCIQVGSTIFLTKFLTCAAYGCKDHFRFRRFKDKDCCFAGRNGITEPLH